MSVTSKTLTCLRGLRRYFSRIFVFQTKAASQPVNQSYSSQVGICDGTHSGEAVNPKHLLNLLGPLNTSKTRLKLLTRVFLNLSVDGYLQGLSRELDENTNSIRVELNRLEKAGLLASNATGRRNLYSVNTTHPLTSDLTSFVRKVSGIDAFANGGDQNNYIIPERAIREKIGLALIDGLGEKIQSRSELLNNL